MVQNQNLYIVTWKTHLLSPFASSDMSKQSANLPSYCIPISKLRTLLSQTLFKLWSNNSRLISQPPEPPSQPSEFHLHQLPSIHIAETTKKIWYSTWRVSISLALSLSSSGECWKIVEVGQPFSLKYLSKTLEKTPSVYDKC